MQPTIRTAKHARWIAIVSLVASAALLGARPYESPLLAECRAAMSTMMSAMHAAPHADADGEFASMMIPHHEGAIAMARAELRYGKNERLRRLAQEMIITQQQEIVAMRMAAADSAQRTMEK